MKFRGISIFIALMLILPAFGISEVGAEDNALPYTYYFDYVSGTSGSREMLIDFEYTISARDDDLISVSSADGETIVDPVISAIDSAAISGGGTTLSISFDTSKFDPSVSDYQLSIPVGALTFSAYTQMDDFTIPFKSYDILSGFKSTLFSPSASSSNINTIFALDNAPRDISVFVPKEYVTGIATIHRYEGLIPEGTADRITGPNLSNVDIEADSDVNRVKLTVSPVVNNTNRDLYKRDDVFTTGFAGLNAENSTGSPQDITINAFDSYGKKVETRSFKMRVTDPAEDFIVEDYITPAENSGNFGRSFSLYELMEDTSLLESIISRIPVSQLDNLGILYPNVDYIARVESINQLARALADDDITVIDGLSSSINSDIVVGDGSNKTISISNMTINGDLTIDVGAAGSATFRNITVTGNTTIISGGTNSIILDDFTTAALLLNNTSNVKVVITGNSSVATLTVNESGVLIVCEGPAAISQLIANNEVKLAGTGTISSRSGPVAEMLTAAPTATDGPYISNTEKTAGVNVVVSWDENVAEVGDTLELLLDGSPWTTPQSYTVTGAEGGTHTFNVPSSAGWDEDGSKAITARFSNLASGGICGTASPALNLELDTRGPSLSSAVRDSDTQITVTLNELADATSIDQNNDGGFEVYKTGSATAYAVSAINPGATNDKVVLTVANMSAAGSTGVTVKYTSGGNGIVTDVAGNSMATDSTGVLVVASDTTLPTLSSAARNNNTSITLTLSEEAESASITKANAGGFVVHKTGFPSTSYAVSEINPGASNNQVVLTVADMRAAGSLGVTVKYTSGGDGTVADEAGNLMATDNTGVLIGAWDSNAPTATLTSATADNRINITEKAAGFDILVQSSEVGGTIYVVPTGSYASESALDAVDIGSVAVGDADTDETITIAAAAANVVDGVFEVYAVDRAGNLSDAAADSIIVDLIAPTLSYPSSWTHNNGAQSIEMAASEPLAAAAGAAIAAAGAGNTFSVFPTMTDWGTDATQFGFEAVTENDTTVTIITNAGAKSYSGSLIEGGTFGTAINAITDLAGNPVAVGTPIGSTTAE